MIITTEQKVSATVEFFTAAGSLGRVDGVPVWTSSDTAVATVVVSADGFSAEIISVAVGTADITVTGDGDLTSGVRAVVDVVTIDVVSPEVVTAEIILGVPMTKV